jgi:hypothetical protein
MANTLTDDGWLWRARQQVMAWLPPEASVESFVCEARDGGTRIIATGRLGDVAIEWWAYAATADEALDELIRHVRRTPREVLARAYASTAVTGARAPT